VVAVARIALDCAGCLMYMAPSKINAAKTRMVGFQNVDMTFSF
jgi:hypothetical protein